MTDQVTGCEQPTDGGRPSLFPFVHMPALGLSWVVILDAARDLEAAAWLAWVRA